MSNLPVQQDAPLFLDNSLYIMLFRYLEEKPYKLVKPIADTIKPVERVNPETGEPMTVYTLPRSTASTLLNQIMGNEEMIRTYMFIRQGYEKALVNDREVANKNIVSSTEKTNAKPKKKKIKEIEISDDNIIQ